MIVRLETNIQRVVISLKCQFGEFSAFYLVIGSRFQNGIPFHTQVLALYEQDLSTLLITRWIIIRSEEYLKDPATVRILCNYKQFNLKQILVLML